MPCACELRPIRGINASWRSYNSAVFSSIEKYALFPVVTPTLIVPYEENGANRLSSRSRERTSISFDAVKYFVHLSLPLAIFVNGATLKSSDFNPSASFKRIMRISGAASPFSTIKTTTSCSISGKTSFSNVTTVSFEHSLSKYSRSPSAYLTCKISAGKTNTRCPPSFKS